MALPFSVIIWYLLLNCSIRYEVLGDYLSKMNQESVGKKVKVSDKEKHKHLLNDLTTSIVAHVNIRELTIELESFCSKLFLIQIGTSALCICGSIYCLAFDIGENAFDRLVHIFTLFYYISEIFMISFFGNEITLSSDCLSYCLFESNWMDQPQSTKKCVVIFGEFLMQPHELVIGKLYPLTLATFTRIINSAYSMFNILQNTAK